MAIAPDPSDQDQGTGSNLLMAPPGMVSQPAQAAPAPATGGRSLVAPKALAAAPSDDVAASPYEQDRQAKYDTLGKAHFNYNVLSASVANNVAALEMDRRNLDHGDPDAIARFNDQVGSVNQQLKSLDGARSQLTSSIDDYNKFVSNPQLYPTKQPERIGNKVLSVIDNVTSGVRNVLSPLLGPTESQKLNDSVLWTGPDGETSYQYKPLGGKLAQAGLLPTAVSLAASIPEKGAKGVIAPMQDAINKLIPGSSDRDWENMRALTQNQNLPREQIINSMSGPANWLSKAATMDLPSIIGRTAAASISGGTTTMAQAAANGVAFGVQEDGSFNPYQGALMAALPTIGKIGEQAVAAAISSPVKGVANIAIKADKYGNIIRDESGRPVTIVTQAFEGKPYINNEFARKVMEKIVGNGGAQTIAMEVAQYPQIAQLPHDQQKDAIISTAAYGMAFALLHMPGVVDSKITSAGRKDLISRVFFDTDNQLKLSWKAPQAKPETPSSGLDEVNANIDKAFAQKPQQPTTPNAPNPVTNPPSVPAQPQATPPVGQPQPAGGAGGGVQNPAGEPAPVAPAPAAPVAATTQSQVAANTPKAGDVINGWTFKPAMAINTEGLPPDLVAQVKEANKGKEWELTDRRPGSPTEGLTTYVPEGSSKADIKTAIDHKTTQFHQSKNAAATPPGQPVTATAPGSVNLNPTPEQKESGEYKKGPITVQGIPIAIENPAGSIRSKTNDQGKSWSVKMPADYGEIKNASGKDGDNIDVYVGPEHGSRWAFVVNQVDPKTGKFDEHKILLGYHRREQAEAVYDAAFSDGSGPERRKTGMVVTTVENLKKWLKDGDHTKEYPAIDPSYDWKVGDKIPWDGTTYAVHHVASGNGARVYMLVSTNPKSTPVYGVFGKDEAHGEVLVNKLYTSFESAKAEMEGITGPTDVQPPAAPEKSSKPGRSMQPKKTQPAPAPKAEEFPPKYKQGDWLEWTDAAGKVRQGRVEYITKTGHVIPGQGVQPPTIEYNTTGGSVTEDANPKKIEAPGPPIGSKGSIGNIPSVLRENQTISGIRYELFEPQQPDDLSHVRVTDLDSGKLAMFKSYPNFPMAKADFDKHIEFAKQPPPSGASTSDLVDAAKKLGKLEIIPVTGQPAKEPSTEKSNDGWPEGVSALRKELKLLMQGKPVAEDMAINDKGESLRILEGKIAAVRQKIADLLNAPPKAKTNEKATTETPGAKPGRTLRPRLPDVQRPPDVDEGKPTGAGGEPPQGRPATKPPERGGEPGAEGAGGNIPEVRSEHGAGDGLPDNSTSGRPSDDTGSTPEASGAGTEQKPKPVAPKALTDEQKNYRISPSDNLGAGGNITKARNNIAAIKLLKKLQAEDDRLATPEEKSVLAKYVGWGALKQLFDRAMLRRLEEPNSWRYNQDQTTQFENWKKQYANLAKEVKELLSDEDWEAAAHSSLNAHFTSPDVITKGLWPLAERLGFKGGVAIETSAGIGNIMGLAPDSIADKIKWGAVEMDKTTGAMLEKLYPQAKVFIQGFQDAPLKDNSADMIISNFPFHRDGPIDKRYPRLNLHNYFFVRSLDVVKPGGLVVAITSNGTLDAPGSLKARELMAGKADLVGAIRLPNDAFKKNAGTEVTTDILVFRKHDGTAWPDAQPFRNLLEGKTYDGKPIDTNEYYMAHPENMLGRWSLEGTMYGDELEPALLPNEGQELVPQLEAAVARFPENIAGRAAPKLEAFDQGEKAKEGLKEGSLTVSPKDKQVYQVVNGTLMQPEWAKTPQAPKLMKQAADYIRLRDATITLINAQRNPDEGDAYIEGLRRALGLLYDAYVKKYNWINHRGSDFLSDDTEFPLLQSLEIPKQTSAQRTVAGKERTVTKTSYEKAEVFTKRTIHPHVAPTEADNLADAARISLAYQNTLNPEYIGQLLGKPPEEVQKMLLDSGEAFQNPETGLLEPPDEYLSGFVRKKYNAAKAAAESDKTYAANVAALEKALPPPLPKNDITFRLGSTWIPPQVVEQFMEAVLGVNATVTYEPLLSKWRIGNITNEGNAKNTSTFGSFHEKDGAHSGLRGDQLIADALNLKSSTISFPDEDENGQPISVKDRDASLAAQQMQDTIKEEFVKYVRSQGNQMDTLADLYNEFFNGVAMRKWRITEWPKGIYPGANEALRLNDHQKAAVSRGLAFSYGLFHGVGLGKTFVMITTAMEMRRLGIAKKPMIVCQNATVSQFAAQFKRLYPASKILVPNENERSAENRKRLVARIATGDFDAVILPQSFVNMLPDDPDRVRSFINEQVREMELAKIRAAAEDGKRSPRTRDLQTAIDKLRDKLREMSERKVDKALTFEQLGVDAMFVDEAHAYKKLQFTTQMQNIKGLDKDFSERAFGMFMKVRHVQERNNGKNVIFATGTPVSNTMAEAWTMMRFLRPDVLEEFHIKNFDQFVSTFAEVVHPLEMTATGDWQTVERLAKFVNGPELIRAFHTVGDVKFNDDVKGVDVPAVKQTNLTIPQTPQVAAYVKYLRERLQRFKEMSPAEKKENTAEPMLVFGLARKATLDMRLIEPETTPDEGCKLDVAIKHIFDRWKESTPVTGVQAVFSSLYQSPDPTKQFSGGKNRPVPNPYYGRIRFNLFEEIKKRLIAEGIPAEQIGIIQDAKNAAQRTSMVNKAKAGLIRVLIGTDEKMGVGLDLQDHGIAINHLDAPNRPMDVEQRNGRMVRQGNPNPMVELLSYGVENTLDAALFQRLATKQRYTNQVLRGDITGRDFDDPGAEITMTYEEQMAAFSGDPLAPEKVGLEGTIRNLQSLKKTHDRQVEEAADKIARLKRLSQEESDSVKPAVDRAERLKATFPTDKSEVDIHGKKFTDKKEAAEAVSSFFMSGIEQAEKEAAKKNLANDFSLDMPSFTYNGMKVVCSAVVPIDFTTGKQKSGGQGMVFWRIQNADGHAEMNGQHRSGNGFFQSVAQQVDYLQHEPRSHVGNVERWKKDILELESLSKQPFQRESELVNAETRLREIIALIAERQKAADAAAHAADQEKKEGGDEDEKEGSLATGEDRPGIILPPQRAKGAQSIREMLTDPNNGLSPEVRAIAAKALEIPGLDWDRMTTELIQGNGQFQGAAYVKQMLIRLTRNAKPEALPHEVMHFLWYLLPKEYQDAIEASRLEAIKQAFGDNAPAQLLSGKMNSDDYLTADWVPADMRKDGIGYHLINAREYFAGYGGERFANENAIPDDGAGGKDKSWWQAFADKVKGWIKALVDLFRKKGANEKAYDDLMAGKFKPDPTTGADIEDVAERSLVRSEQEYERRQALGEKGTAEGTAAAYGSLAKMKYEVARSLNASDRAMAILNIPRQMALSQRAFADTGLESYYDVRAQFAQSSPYIRAEIALSAYHLLGIEQRKSLNIQDAAAKQEALLQSAGFRLRIKRMVMNEAKLAALKEAEETYKNQIGEQASQIMKNLQARKTADAKAEQLREDLSRVQSMPQFAQAVTQRVEQIVNVLASHPESLKLLLYGIGKGGGTELANKYFSMSSDAGNPVTGSDERAFVLLAAQVLAANRDMRRTLSLLSFAKDRPEFQAELSDVGKMFADKLEKNPAGALNWLVKNASKLTEARTNAEAAWVMLNKGVLREVEKHIDLQKAVEVDGALKEAPAWRKLVNNVHADAKGVRFPDRIIKQMGAGEGFDEFESKPTLASPTGNSYQIDLGVTKKDALGAWESVKSYLNELDGWLRDPKNSDSHDRKYWQNRRDFVESVYYVSTTSRPTAIEPRLASHSWWIPDYLFDQLQLPQAKVARVSMENFGASFNSADGWVHNHQEQMVNANALAAKSHGYSTTYELRRWQEDVLDQMGYLSRTGKKLEVGDVLDNGIELTKQDVAALRAQGSGISKLINSVRNVGREKVMKDKLLVDQWAADTFGIRQAHEIGGEIGTTLPHNFSDRGKVLARIISGMIENGASREDVKSVLNQANNFDFVRYFMAQRRASFIKTLSPFEDQYKELAEKVRAKDSSAPTSIDDIVDYLENNTTEEFEPGEVEGQLLSEMTGMLANLYKKYFEPTEADATKVWRTETSTALTRGFVADVANSFFYNYGVVTDGDIRALANDASNYHLVRVDKALDSLEQEMVKALDAFKNSGRTQEDRKEWLKAARARHASGEDFRNFDILESQLQQVRDFRQMVPSWSGNKTVEAAMVRRGSRLIQDYISSKLSGIGTFSRILIGSTVKVGQVFAAADRNIALSTARGIVSMAMSAIKLESKLGVSAMAQTIANNSPRALAALITTKGGISLRMAETVKAALNGLTEEMMRSSSYLNQQYKLGLITDAMLGHKLANMIMMPQSRGRGYEPAMAAKKWARIPANIANIILTSVELPIEVFAAHFPRMAYNIAYDAAARQAGWTIDMLEAAARRAFDVHEKMGTLERFNLDDPSDPNNVLLASQVLPRGIVPKTQVDLSAVREWFRAIDQPYDETVIRFWKKLSETAKADRKSVRLLGDKDIAERRAMALMAVSLRDVHHAAPTNRPWVLRSTPVLRVINPFLGWTSQSTRQILTSVGKAPHDPEHGKWYLRALALAYIGAVIGVAGLTGDGDRRFKSTMQRFAYNEQDSVKTLGQGQTPGENALIFASGAIGYIPMLQTIANSLLGLESGRGGMNIQPIALGELNSWLQLVQGIIHTKDLSYGVIQFIKQQAPLSKVVLNRLPTQEGLVEEKNARNILSKYGPTDLLRTQGGSGYDVPVPTPLTPLKQTLANAIFSGDQKAITEAFDAFAQKAQDIGRKEPQKLANEVFESLNPYRQVFGTVLTESQRQSMMANMSPGERQTIENVEERYQQAGASLGERTAMTKEEVQQGRQSVGGGVGGSNVPNFAQIQPQAPGMRLSRSTGFKGSGGGTGRTIGSVRGVRTGSSRSFVSRGNVVGSAKARLGSGVRSMVRSGVSRGSGGTGRPRTLRR